MRSAASGPTRSTSPAASHPHGVETTLAVLGPPPDASQRRRGWRRRRPRRCVADRPAARLDRGDARRGLDAPAPPSPRLPTSAGADLVHLNSAGARRRRRLPGAGRRRLPFLRRDLVGGRARPAPLPDDFAWRAELRRAGLSRRRRARRADGRLRRRRPPRPTACRGARRRPQRPRDARAAPRPAGLGVLRLHRRPALGRGQEPRGSRPRGRAPRRPGRRGRAARRAERRARSRSPHVAAARPARAAPRSRAGSARCPIFVSAARYEPFGLAVLEAAQAGCALVLSDIPTFRELWDGAALFVPRRRRPRPSRSASRRSSRDPRPARRARRPRRGARAASTPSRPWPTACSRSTAPLLVAPAAGEPHGGGGMRIVYFTHSLASCWNHGNAHFLRGVLRELIARGPRGRRRFEPADALEPRRTSLARSRRGRPRRLPRRLSRAALAHATTRTVDLEPAPRRRRPRDRARVERAGARRGASARARRARRPLHAPVPRHAPPRGQRSGGDPRASTSTATTASSPSARRCARSTGAGAGADRVFVWHEAADTRLFHPPAARRERATAWSGSATGATTSAAPSSRRSCCGPARRLGLPLDIYGVRYPDDALQALRRARRSLSRLAAERRGARGLRPPSRDRPRAAPPLCRRAARHPDHPRLRGAGLRHPARLRAVARLRRACSGPARTILVARDGPEMERASPRRCATIPACAAASSRSGLETIRARHTCAHRVDELLAIAAALGAPAPLEMTA